jgi:photosystem II stability/assembly factor-like uncharacterized protein
MVALRSDNNATASGDRFLMAHWTSRFTRQARRLLLAGFAAALPIVAVPTLAAEGEDAVAAVVKGLPMRGIGPAFMGGRVSDIAVHPQDRRTWYVTAGSGGVWKTTNAGTTFTPVFDDQGSFSIGTVTIDPNNPEVVWVGTGENVSGRHVAWGDGIYRSRDGGKTWTNMGLKASEHISRIIVHPEDSNTVLVAAEGPLWSAGGERGVYRTEDGGETWERVLYVDDDTGATDVLFNPADPSVVYAATYQRRRTAWSFLAGGPGSGIHKSTDGGRTWREITNGLPSAKDKVALGKIGLAVTPADPDRVYATVEASDDEQGFYVSRDRGESWTRRNNYISGGTGPHYYQEIFASPTHADRVYQMDVFLHRTSDGGNTFAMVGDGVQSHTDNHALWIDPEDDRHLIVGNDGGLYESFDLGATWRFFSNLPISQFYKIAPSYHEPFYDVLGGAQDLGTLRGPARTMNTEGVRNRDWNVPYGADGYGVAFDPFDNDLHYHMWQNGNLARHHSPSFENVVIKPQPAEDDAVERWNWDAPLEVSETQEGRIYYGSQRVWRSTDRGDSWTPISGDLTTDTNRFTLPMAGRVRSVDALLDLGAMSRYATLTAISESVLDGQRLWVGSDDGLVHTTANGGESWSNVSIKGLPERAFVNDVEASRHDAQAAFVVADDHKSGDYRPYVYATDNGGRSWRDISGNLPEDVIVWAIQQDDEEPGLLFLGTEKGLYVTLDGGKRWDELAGTPTISFRDVKLQRRDLDVVGGTFGRGIYILDDYTPLRELAARVRESGSVADESTLFGLRDAWWYIPGVTGQAPGLPSQGSAGWRAENPPHGAVFTVHLADVPKTPKESRREREREIAEKGGDVPFPGWDRLMAERRAGEARHYLEIMDSEGNSIRRLAVPSKAGTHRVAWDMRGAPPDAVSISEPGFRPPWWGDPQGALYPPGSYQARLVRVGPEAVSVLGETRSFRLRAVDNLPAGVNLQAAPDFQKTFVAAERRLEAVNGTLKLLDERVRYLRKAMDEAPGAAAELHLRLDAFETAVDEVRTVLNGNQAKQALNEFTEPGVAGRIRAARGVMDTRMTPTRTERENLRIGVEGLGAVESRVRELREKTLADIEQALSDAGGPWTPGQPVGGR